MHQDFVITIGADGKPIQYFNGKSFKLQSGERYFNSGAKKMHVYVWEYYNGKVEKGYHIHHVDTNTWNNDIKNLEKKLASTHQSEHSKKRCKEDKEWFRKFREGSLKAASAWKKTDEGRASMAKRAKNSWKNRTGYGAGNCECCGREYVKINYNSRFCSNACKTKYRKASGVDNETRTCGICGSIFITDRYSKAKLCSQRCVGLDRWKKEKAPKTPPPGLKGIDLAIWKAEQKAKK